MLPRLGKIVSGLHTQPEISITTQRFFQTQRQTRRYGAFAFDDPVKLLSCDTNPFGSSRNGKAQGLDIVFNQGSRMSRIVHCHDIPLMIVYKINVTGAFVHKPKNNTPVGANCYRPKSLKIALQSMKPKTWPIHLFNRFCLIERCQYDAYPFHHIRWQTAPIVVLVKSPKPFMPQTFDHIPSTISIQCNM